MMTNLARYQYVQKTPRKVGTFVSDHDLSMILGKNRLIPKSRLNLIKGEIIEGKHGRTIHRRKKMVEEIIGKLYPVVSKRIYDSLLEIAEELALKSKDIRSKRMSQIIFTLSRVIATQNKEVLPLQAYAKVFGTKLTPTQQVEALSWLVKNNFLTEKERPFSENSQVSLPTHELAMSLGRDAEFNLGLPRNSVRSRLEELINSSIIPRVEPLRAALVMVNAVLIELNVLTSYRLHWIESKLPEELKSKAYLIDRASMRFRSYHNLSNKK